jgi:hypothetical protein
MALNAESENSWGTEAPKSLRKAEVKKSERECDDLFFPIEQQRTVEGIEIERIAKRKVFDSNLEWK